MNLCCDIVPVSPRIPTHTCPRAVFACQASRNSGARFSALKAGEGLTIHTLALEIDLSLPLSTQRYFIFLLHISRAQYTHGKNLMKLEPPIENRAGGTVGLLWWKNKQGTALRRQQSGPIVKGKHLFHLQYFCVCE